MSEKEIKLTETLLRKLTCSSDNDYLYKTIDNLWPGKPTRYMFTVTEEERLFLKKVLKDKNNG